MKREALTKELLKEEKPDKKNQTTRVSLKLGYRGRKRERERETERNDAVFI